MSITKKMGENREGDLVSIIMLSRNRGGMVVDSVKSVLAQTYTNWELIFLDDSSNDGTIHQLMTLRERDNRIKVSQTVEVKGFGVNRISALRSANGRWIAFLDCGDIWEPTKLEHQIAFMTQYGYSFSYTKYRYSNKSGVQTIEVGGPDTINYSQMQKCCWPNAATVMYDRLKVGPIDMSFKDENNDYALFLLISRQVECHLLNECTATLRRIHSFFKITPLFYKLEWRYEVYNKIDGQIPIVSLYMVIRNVFYMLQKKYKYAKHVEK